MDDNPFLAMGMVTAPFARGRRDEVRKTMMQLETVRAGRTAFRFIVGDNMPLLEDDPKVDFKAKRSALRAELTGHSDLLQLDSLDGPGIEVACSCVEKTSAWVRYALTRWPSVAFVGKTEDDTYVQLQVLEAEMRTLVNHRNVIYGYMTLAVLPTRPTQYPERYPMRACVTNINQCRKNAQAGMKPYTEGCFLGDLESKLSVPGWRKLPVAATPLSHEQSPLLGWWRGASKACGFPEDGSGSTYGIPLKRRRGGKEGRGSGGGGSGGGGDSNLSLQLETGLGSSLDSRSIHAEPPASSRPRSTMAPFPTGPLAVFSRDLAVSSHGLELCPLVLATVCWGESDPARLASTCLHLPSSLAVT